MYLVLAYKRSFRISRRRVQQANPSINLGARARDELTPLRSPSILRSPSFTRASREMEFTKMQESLNEVWDSWKKSSPEEGTSIIDRSLVPPVNNALIFRFLARKSIGIKDLGTALNSIWRPSAPANVFAIGDGIYLVGFENSTDCNRVLARQP